MSPARSGPRRRYPAPRRPGPGLSPVDLGAPLLVAAAALALFFPVLGFQFLDWDDGWYVLNNPWIRAFTRANLVHIFTQPYFANFLPLHLLSYMVDYRFWGPSAFGFHLQSLLLHVLNSVLAMVVVRRILGGRLVPFLAALLFAVHPSHVEAVAWISDRKDLLSTAFALLTVLFYHRALVSGAPRWGSYAASLVCFTLGLLSKVTIVTLPLFLLLLHVGRPAGGRGRGRLRPLAAMIPYLALGAWLAHLNSAAQVATRASYAHEALQYAMVKGHAAWSYLGLLAGVLRGSPDYDLPGLGRGALTIAAMLAGLLLWPVVAWIAYRRGWRPLFLGSVWIFVLLLPAIGFPLVTYMADRYLYLPSLGFCWIVAAGVRAAGARLADPRARAAVVAGLALVPLAGFTARTMEALPVWRDSESLWSYAITRCGDYRAFANLAAVRLAQKRWDEAERLLRESAKVENPTTYQNYGVLYYQKGKYAESAAAFERALAILAKGRGDSRLASVLQYNLGAVYSAIGDSLKTIAALEASVREDPTNEQARKQLEVIRGGAPGP